MDALSYYAIFLPGNIFCILTNHFIGIKSIALSQRKLGALFIPEIQILPVHVCLLHFSVITKKKLQ